ncbi:hypothetical protein AOLI_G00023240 [Acnodon oligacanthus]
MKYFERPPTRCSADSTSSAFVSHRCRKKNTVITASQQLISIVYLSNIQMWQFWVVGLASCFLGAACGAEVCYGDLGCFPEYPSNGSCKRPHGYVPQSPEKINTKFYLFTPENPDKYQVISADRDSIAESNYKSRRRTRFIIHGFISKGDDQWLLDMCQVMLTVEDVNCICVDWKSGAWTGYKQAVNKIRVVGAQVAQMIAVFRDNFKQSPDNVHVIGHSLGAHCAGEAGQRTPGLGRITGLDPAGPYFKDCPALVRLDPTDALFVDAIHTDSLAMLPYIGLGMPQAVGHLDFYPNGGEEMPGCGLTRISENTSCKDTRDIVPCNHLRAYKYYTDTITTSAGFLGYPCSNYTEFESGECLPCADGACATMGHFADTFHVPSGVENMKFYLNTARNEPFACYRYKVSVTISGTESIKGYFNVELYDSSEITQPYRIYSGIITPGKTYEHLIDVEEDVGDLSNVMFSWNHSWQRGRTFGASQITVQRGRDGKVFTFFGEGQVQEKVRQTLNPCE